MKLNRQVKGGEPLNLSEVKDWLRVDGDDDDSLITNLITQVRELVESYLGTSIALQDITLTTGNGGSGITLPYQPIASITSVQDDDGNDVSYDWNGYMLSFNNMIISVTAGSTPDHFTVVYEAGYATIPAGLKLGLLEVIAWLYENRGDAGKLNYMIYQNANLQPYRAKIWFT